MRPLGSPFPTTGSNALLRPSRALGSDSGPKASAIRGLRKFAQRVRWLYLDDDWGRMAVHGTDAAPEQGTNAGAAHGTDAGAARANGAPAPGPVADAGPAPPATEGGGGNHRRDEMANRRDQAAQERDHLAVQRDLDADIADQTVRELEGSEEVIDRRTLRVEELRSLGRQGRQRAAGSRERAKRDRTLAGADRVFGASDRYESKQDRQHASTDELTGARRRGVGLEDLQREIDRARRTGESLVAAYVDVDGLKAVNDEHGHHAGDNVLRDVVARLRRDMRPYDLLVRLGGDEFLCVLSGVDANEARRRFERLGADLRAGPCVRSVSVGLGELRDGEGPQELVDRADQDLLAGRAQSRREAR
jgi:diguanylate cyclase (GGDEF)-like protein